MSLHPPITTFLPYTTLFRSADAQITEAGMVTGTVQYLAPEQLQGEPADPRTDLYALGIVGFELLTGSLPFTAETRSEEHTSELQSPCNLVYRLLLEKKIKND